MKKLLLCLALVLMLLLCGCSTRYENAAHTFSIKFPDSMQVFDASATGKDDPLLETYNVPYDKLQSFAADGGIYFAKTLEENGVTKEVSVSVQQSDYTKSLWELTGADESLVIEYQNELIESFQSNGITVKQKGKFQQGKAYCVYLNIISGNFDSYDTVYMSTVYNGKQYSVLYQSAKPLTDKDVDQCHDIFDSFHVTETVANPLEEPKDNTVAKAVLVVIFILAIVLSIVFTIRMFSHKKHLEEEEKNDTYVPQFADTFSSTKKSKEKRK